ncbi:hypothetical protein BYT27DRAFT_6737077 [Phlegmacium glaucopus]|nr:hypothetical protein BYT27DRAFT_6737077 [Phlegmacium glaucopus]
MYYIPFFISLRLLTIWVGYGHRIWSFCLCLEIDFVDICLIRFVSDTVCMPVIMLVRIRYRTELKFDNWAKDSGCVFYRGATSHNASAFHCHLHNEVAKSCHLVTSMSLTEASRAAHIHMTGPE